MCIYCCKICSFQTENIRSFTQHISNHDYTSKSYYDHFLKSQNDGICSSCGKNTSWVNLNHGYRTFCSQKCSSPTALSKQWSGEKGTTRRQKLSKSMMGNRFSEGRPKGSVNRLPYPKDSIYKRLEKNPMPSWQGKLHTEETKSKMSESAYKRMERIGLPKSYKGKFSPKNPKKI